MFIRSRTCDGTFARAVLGGCAALPKSNTNRWIDVLSSSSRGNPECRQAFIRDRLDAIEAERASLIEEWSIAPRSRIRPSPDPGRDALVGDAKRRRAIAVIDDRLRQLDLSPATIARAAGLSRSALYRLFEPSGGVVRFIQHRRLAALRRAVGRPGEIRPLATLALDHGFVSASHASRSFKEHFGMTLGEWRGLLRATAVDISAFEGLGPRRDAGSDARSIPLA